MNLAMTTCLLQRRLKSVRKGVAIKRFYSNRKETPWFSFICTRISLSTISNIYQDLSNDIYILFLLKLELPFEGSRIHKICYYEYSLQIINGTLLLKTYIYVLSTCIQNEWDKGRTDSVAYLFPIFVQLRKIKKSY